MKTENWFQKEQTLLDALASKNWPCTDGDRDRALADIRAALDGIAEYVLRTARNNALSVLNPDMEPEGERERAANWNRTLSGIDAMNRIAASVDMAPFFDVDTGDAEDVRTFCGQYFLQTYTRGTSFRPEKTGRIPAPETTDDPGLLRIREIERQIHDFGQEDRREIRAS